jgi:hypothetical protein
MSVAFYPAILNPTTKLSVTNMSATNLLSTNLSAINMSSIMTGKTLMRLPREMREDAVSHHSQPLLNDWCIQSLECVQTSCAYKFSLRTIALAAETQEMHEMVDCISESGKV